MHRVATCPKCRTVYELDEDDIGHLMECECGAALFACHARTLEVFNLFCVDCGIEHQVRGADVGSVVELVCGASVRVPSVVLRLPVGGHDLAARAASEWRKQEMGVAVDVGGANQPARHARENDDSSHEAKPDEAKTNDQSVHKKVESRPVSASDGRSTSDARLNSRSDRSSESRRTAPSQRNLGSTLGIFAVATLFIGAVAMYLLREPPSQRRLNQTKATSQSSRSIGIETRRIPEAQSSLVIAGTGLNLGSQNTGVSSLPMARVTQAPSGNVAGVSGRRGGYRLPPPTIYALPEKKTPRQRIAVQVWKSSFPNLQSALETAFEKYKRVQKLKEQADASNSPTDMKEYQKAIAGAIGLIEQVHELAVAKSANQEIATTRYLLAFLYLKAGMLPEAAVVGAALARWGELADPSTKEAGLIALAATQELSDLHWGDEGDLGELRQMEEIANILQSRWPDDRQNDLIWMNLGYLYEAFNQPQYAVRIYENILQSSEHYGTAVLASGMSEWNVLRQQQAATGKAIDSEDRKRVKQRIAKGLRLVEQRDGELMVNHVDARLALAQIDLISGKPEMAEQWLTVEPSALLSSIRVRDDDDESKLLIDEAVARQLYDVLFHARKEMGDTKGATQAIEDLAVLVGDSGEEMATRRITLLKSAFEKLKERGEMHNADFESAKEMSNRIMQDSSVVPTATVLWLGESWAQVGERNSSAEPSGQNKFADEAARLAAEFFDVAIKRNDFPKESLQAVQLRRIDLLRRSGEVMQSLKQIEDMLANEPNVFTLQIAAAQCLQQVAVKYERSSDLVAAIEGPSGFSPIWGWGKLVTTLHATRYSASATPRHTEQLALAQYNLFWCRYQLAFQIKDPEEKQRQLTAVEKSLAKTVAIMDKKSDWYVRYKNLLDQISSSS